MLALMPVSLKFQLLTIFYKSTIVINVTVSMLFAVMGLALGTAYFFRMFAVSFVSAGPVVCILYNEISSRDQYYFYYNNAVSKPWLISWFLVANVFIAALIFSLPLLW